MGFIKKVVIILFINLAFIGLIFFGGELFLRYHLFSLPIDKAHLPHPYLQVIMNPDIRLGMNEFLGPLGLRGTGAYHKGNHVYKVIALGDSCTFSVGSSNEFTSYPMLLEDALSNKFHSTVEVYNAGVPGYNTMQMLLKFNALLKEVKPDEVIIYGGWNDFRILTHDRGRLYIENNTAGMPENYRYPAYWELNTHRQESSFLDRLFANSYFYNHTKFSIIAHYEKEEIRAFWQKNGLESIPQPNCILMPVIDNFSNNLENIIAMARGRGAKVSLITLATPLKDKYTADEEKKFREFESKNQFFLRLTPAEERQYVVQFNRIIRQLSRQYGTELYDWEKWYSEAYDLSLFVDQIHPNDKGYRYLVDKIIAQRNKL